MKKLIGTLAICLIAGTSSAQIHQHAIGLRGGGGTWGYGPEISYQGATGDNNRFELDLGWYSRRNWNNGNGLGSNSYNLISFSGVYHWLWNIDGGFNWYVGPGAQIVFYDEKYEDFDDFDDGIYIAVGGQIGIEYDFSVHAAPLQLGLDYRPMFLFSAWNDVGHGAALSLRYLID
jgi:hypothetical protein